MTCPVRSGDMENTINVKKNKNARPAIQIMLTPLLTNNASKSGNMKKIEINMPHIKNAIDEYLNFSPAISFLIA